MPRVGRHLLAVVATFLGGGLVSPAAMAYEPRVTDDFFGISQPDLWALTAKGSTTQRDAQLAGMKANGLDWVRSELAWPDVEPVAPEAGTHSYRWTTADRHIEALADHQMRLVPLLVGSPGWAQDSAANAAGCGRRSAVAGHRLDDYAAFAEAVVRRYGPAGAFWRAHPDLPYRPVTSVEVWNEPNFTSFWCPAVDPERYASLLARTARRIHAATPSVNVMLGGLTAAKRSTDTMIAADEFLSRVVAREPSLATDLDAVAFHPYELDPQENLSLIGWLRYRMNALGLTGADIALTEFGWHGGASLQGSLSETQRAAKYREMVNALARTDCGITGIAAHKWSSPELNLLEPTDWWGIASPVTGILHLAGEAYRDQVALFEGRGPTPPPRTVLTVCGADPPDQDEDGVPDQEDDYPTDPDRSEGSSDPPAVEDLPKVRPFTQRVPDSFFGATVVRFPTHVDDMEAQYSTMEEVHLGRIHQRIEWSQIEPGGPTSSYSEGAWPWLDRVVLKLARRGIGLQPPFGLRPSWVGPSDAEFASQYTAFMGRFANRYGSPGSFWRENGHLDRGLAVRDYEVWHQGNRGGATDPDTLAARYAGLYSRVKAAVNGADPEARTVASLTAFDSGGAGPFIRAMVRARSELRGGIDAVYVDAAEASTPSEVDGVVQATRRALDETGNGGSPIHLAFGRPVAGAGAISEADRARFFESVASRMARSDCGVERIFAHAWLTGQSTPDDPWEWFGIADPGTGAPSATAAKYGESAASFTGRGSAEAPRAAVHQCDALPVDRDGDAVPDPADSHPLDASRADSPPPPPAAPRFTATPASLTAETNASFTFEAERAVGFQCKLDEGWYQACPGGGKSYSGLAHGRHTVRVRAVDAIGLVGAVQQFAWEVDTRGPVTRITASPPPILLTDSARVEFAADEPGSQSWCQFDRERWAACSSAFIRGGLLDGPHTLRIASVDKLANLGPTALVRFEVRTMPGIPEIELADGTATGPRPTIGFTIPDAASAECRFESGSWEPCSERHSHQPESALLDGTALFEVRGVGGTAKTGPTASRVLEVDARAPEISGVSLRTRASRAVIRFGIADASSVTSVKCGLDGRTPTTCSSPVRFRRLKRGRHVVRFAVVDEWGNRREASKRWRVRR